MIKQAVIAVSLSVSMPMAGAAFAAQEKHNFEVSVDIPTLEFYVIPSEADWIHHQQTLPWDTHSSTLGGLRKNFDVRTDSSAIEARLESFPILSSGQDSRDDISLRITFNGTELSHQPVPRQVVSREEAVAGKRVRLEIEPRAQPGGYKPGDYYGSVNIIFNVAAPAG
ncbi:CS1 type fimbrial major subunit [Pseudomonas sp. C2B4]|uniref:CS1 type fimbrial major subunit n=1 Tax=Pseudomonas sp. C2B4 TaxID=2735270 RepID=UPI001586F017|nr:CS1 type fimbrial major subunit [Pseudomonas sp. C2B4]NUU36845.1 fimbrial assembly protein [Pseudomonas sp. C2B4]